jgi:hypothetical protein
MHRRIAAALVAVVAAGLLAIASPASAAVPAHCGTRWAPDNGKTAVSVVGNRVTLTLSYTLQGPNTPGTPLYAAKCVASYAKVLVGVDNAGSPGNTYDYDTNLPYSGTAKAPKYQPLATGQLFAGAAVVNTYLLTGETYTMTVAWTKTTADPASFRLYYYVFNKKTGLFGGQCTNIASPLCQAPVDNRQLYATAKPVVPGDYPLGT